MISTKNYWSSICPKVHVPELNFRGSKIDAVISDYLFYDIIKYLAYTRCSNSSNLVNGKLADIEIRRCGWSPEYERPETWIEFFGNHDDISLDYYDSYFPSHYLAIVFLRRWSKDNFVKAVKHRCEHPDASFPWEYSPLLSGFFDKNGNVAAFKGTTKDDEGKEHTRWVVYIDKEATNAEVVHRVTASLGKILPSMFENDPLTEDETELLRNCAQSDLQLVHNKLRAWYNTFDFRTDEIKKSFAGFTTVGIERRKCELEEEISNKNDEINRYMSAINDMLLQIDRKNAELCGLKAQDFSETEKVLINYLLANKSFQIVEKKLGGGIVFAFFGPMDSVSPEAYENLVAKQKQRKNHMFVYSPFDLNKTKRLYEAIWGDNPIFQLAGYAVYFIDSNAACIAYGKETSLGRFDIPGLDLETYIPNPHIYYYNCLGGYNSEFTKCRRNRDFIGAITVAQQSARSLTLEEDITVGKMLREEFWSNTDRKFLRRIDTGEAISINEAYTILDAQAGSTAEVSHEQ